LEQAVKTEGERDIVPVLQRLGFAAADEVPICEPLSGGVSSEIWRVETRQGPICVKRALAKLRVAAVWEAPVERSHAEAEWIRVAGEVCPGATPTLLGEDRAAHLIVMTYLDPARHLNWKEELRRGVVSIDLAGAVGRRLGRIHAATADRTDIAHRFRTDANFYALRLEPYLEATGRAHPDLAPRLADVARTTATTKRALVHGDVSPKNILVGPSGPIFLDAECAWFGDPAFDLAFVLNHLLLKCLLAPAATSALLDAFSALTAAYLAEVAWESAAAAEMRTAALLPGLFLARIDGKSPVEYIERPADKDRVRRVARELLREPVGDLGRIRDRWEGELRL
jgi:aminoglycoside phosphotransferase (APT) family kinase protein